MQVTLFSHLLTDSSPVIMLGEIRSTEVLCAQCEHDGYSIQTSSRLILRSFRKGSFLCRNPFKGIQSESFEKMKGVGVKKTIFLEHTSASS